MDEKKSKYIVRGCIVLIILTIFIIAFGLFILNKNNGYKNELSSFVSSITKINENTCSIISGHTINSKTALNLLPKTINSLSKVNNDISACKVNDKNKYGLESLKNGIKYNILMYKQLLSLIKNPYASDAEISVKNLYKYKNSCDSYYENIKSKDNHFILPYKNTIIIHNCENLISNLMIANKEKEILNTQNIEFQNELQNILSDFKNTKCDLSYYAKSARANKISYDNAISKVDENTDKFNNLQQQFAQISVPKNNLKIYSMFKTILEDYDSYLKSFTKALISEKSSAYSEGEIDYSSIYKDSNKKLSKMNKDFAVLVKNYNNFTNNALN
ncbi:MAG: hypothetical protein PHX70_05150 [Clostridium sp.]|nr:hypothetical protein [Clostridium sp.]